MSCLQNKKKKSLETTKNVKLDGENASQFDVEKNHRVYQYIIMYL